MLASWVDGLSSNGLPLDDRGLAYGHGVFETMRIVDGAVLDLDRHLDRLVNGASQLGIDAPDRSLINQEIQEISEQHKQGILKFILTAGSGGRGYAPPKPMQVRRIVLLYEFVPAPRSYYEAGVNVTVCETRLAYQPMLAGIKHLNRLEQVLARSEWGDQYQEGLMLDHKGFVIEGTMSNLFGVCNDVLTTAPLDGCGVSGIQRQNVIDLARQRGLPMSMNAMTLPQVLNCDELFVCNSVIGIWPVASVMEHNFNVGTISQMFCEEINNGRFA